MQNKKILITGGAGFIGSHLVEELHRENSVIVIDDLSSGHLRNLEGFKNVQIIQASITEPDKICNYFEGVDYVFHLATRNVRLSLVQPSEVHETNINGSYNVLKLCSEKRVSKFLYCSSSEVNGTAREVPMKEVYPYDPETIYGASKLMGEYYTNVFYKSGWLQTTIARPHNNYGPREHYEGSSGEVIPRFIIQALRNDPITIYGDGTQTRDFTYVKDTVQALIGIATHKASLGDTFNVCAGREFRIVDLARMIVDMCKSRSEVIFLPSRPNDVLRLFGDNTKLKSQIGDFTTTALEVGLLETIQWFKTLDIESIKLDTKNWTADRKENWMA